jgi:hypothetical protein
MTLGAVHCGQQSEIAARISVEMLSLTYRDITVWRIWDTGQISVVINVSTRLNHRLEGIRV